MQFSILKKNYKFVDIKPFDIRDSLCIRPICKGSTTKKTKKVNRLLTIECKKPDTGDDDYC